MLFPRRPLPRPRWTVLAGLALALFAAPARGQAPTLTVTGLYPAGARSNATDSWGAFDFRVTNPTDTDRLARVLVFYTGQDDLQYGRDVWVPAHSSRATWLLVGPAAAQAPQQSRELQIRLYDRTDGTDRYVPPAGADFLGSRLVLYKRREPTTAILLDPEPTEEPPPGQLPQPESPADETRALVRSFRQARGLSETVQIVAAGPLPAAAQALDGIDHFVIASDRPADDPAGLAALRHWLEQGGTVWVLLDRVDVGRLSPLLGAALDFEVVDRVSLTSFKVEPPPGTVAWEPPLQEHDRPVELVRVLLPAGERTQHTVNGWPAWFTRRVGRGKVVFTALGARGWFRPRGFGDGPSRFQHFPNVPVATAPLEVVAGELQPPRTEDPIQVDAFRPTLTEQIGYSVVPRGTVALVFAGSLLAALALGLLLRNARRPELLGWLGPVAAVAAAGVLVVLGLSSRRSVPPTEAVAEVVDPAAGTGEAAVHGLLGTYRPDSGPADLGASRGGFFVPDLAGSEGQTRRFIRTDLGAWHWENVGLPAGVRWSDYRATVPTEEPVRAVAHFGPDGLEGKLTTGPFHDAGDALLSVPGARRLAVALRPDGTFRASGDDVLPAGQFLASAVLSDRQQRRQELYQEFLRRPLTGHLEGRPLLLAWADPAELHFARPEGARTVGSALLFVPLELERPAPGTRVTIPGPFVPCRRLQRTGPVPVPREGREGISDMRLRFQLPESVLPFRVEGARLTARINAPSRQVTISGRKDDKLVELSRVDSPLAPIRVDLADPALLRPDDEGGLHLSLGISDAARGGPAGSADDRWTVEYLELEVSGRTAANE